MEQILNFMGEHPWLTFFLALIASGCIVGVFRYTAYALKGKPYLCEDCQKKREEDE